MIKEGLLLQGAKLEIKEDSYLSTKELVSQFMKAVKPFTENEPRIKVKYPDFKVFDDAGKSVIGFTRVSIEYELISTDAPVGYTKVIGLAYALDVKAPISKIYVGYRYEDVLMIPNSDLIVKELIEPDSAIHVGNKVSNLLESATNITAFDKKLSQELTAHTICEKWGFWLMNVIEHGIEEETYKVKLSSTQINKAIKAMLTDQKSDYYVGTSQEIYLFDVFMVVSRVIMDEDKDVITEFEKAVLIARMLGL